MVARAGRCYGTPFKISREVTQSDLLPHPIFNMVVGTFISHWATVVA